MIATNSIGYRLLTMISSDPVLVSSGFKRVDLGAPIYPDRIQGPVVTIHPGKFGVSPHLISALQSGSYLGPVQFNIFHSDFSATSAGEVFLRLMLFQDRFTSLVASNPLLDGLVDTLESMEAEWFQYDPVASDIAQVRVITLNYTVRG